MKKKSNMLLSIAIALIGLALILWINNRTTDDTEPVSEDLSEVTTNQNADPESTSEELSEVTIMIYANDEELVNETLEVSYDMTLMAIMEENYELTVSDEGFVESIEGIEQNVEENKFWVFEANEEMVTESAEDFVPADGDTILWEFLKF